VDHLFLQCAVAKFCWGVVRDVLGWGYIPFCVEDRYAKLIEGSSNENRNFAFLIGCLTWSLWLIRNNFVFNNSLISNPDVGIYRAISFMQKWNILSKEKERVWIDMVITKLKRRLASLRPD
jgi:hypothetical protein